MFSINQLKLDIQEFMQKISRINQLILDTFFQKISTLKAIEVPFVIDELTKLNINLLLNEPMKYILLNLLEYMNEKIKV